MSERRLPPLAPALMALGVLPVHVSLPSRRELPLSPPTRHTEPLDLIERGVGIEGLRADYMGVLAPAEPMRIKKRPLAEKKARRTKRKQRRNR